MGALKRGGWNPLTNYASFDADDVDNHFSMGFGRCLIIDGEWSEWTS